jgi:K+-sensing histidine kinase KdpD
MSFTPPGRTLRAILYGGGTALLLLDTFFLIQAAFTRNFVPIVPVIAGIFTALGLLLIVYAEQRAREDDKKAHRRIARVSHQLTTPLKMLQEDINEVLDNANKLPSNQRLQLKRMSTKSNIVLDNIRDVFLTLQAQEGKISQEIQAHDICQLIEEANKRVASLASARNTDIQFKKHCPKALARVDKRLFLIVLTHVLENAIYYSLTPGKINLNIVKGNKYTRIIVRDRGVGIKKSEADIVFKPFARGDDAAKYDPDGIGIGLALSKLIINEFKGTISWTKKTPGTGTQFEIRLPLLTD